jgi:hypothetical protein
MRRQEGKISRADLWRQSLESWRDPLIRALGDAAEVVRELLRPPPLDHDHARS